jgi:hypothetical protein
VCDTSSKGPASRAQPTTTPSSGPNTHMSISGTPREVAITSQPQPLDIRVLLLRKSCSQLRNGVAYVRALLHTTQADGALVVAIRCT